MLEKNMPPARFELTAPGFGILPGLSLKLREHLSHGKHREKGFEIFCEIVSIRLGLDTRWTLCGMILSALSLRGYP